MFQPSVVGKLVLAAKSLQKSDVVYRTCRACVFVQPDYSATSDRNRPGTFVVFMHQMFEVVEKEREDSMAQPSTGRGAHMNRPQLYASRLNSLKVGYGRRDDGRKVGSVHPIQKIELVHVLGRIGSERALYVDTFAMVEALWRKAESLQADPDMHAALAAQDGVAGQRIVGRTLFGG